MNHLPVAGQYNRASAAIAARSAQWVFLLTASIVSGLIVWLGDDPFVWVFGLALLTCAALISVGCDLSHPYTWYVPIFALYAAFQPLLVALERRKELGFLHQTCILEWMALTTFIIVVGPARRKIAPSLAELKRLATPALVVFWISVVPAALFFWYVWASGFTSKYDIALSQSLIVRVGGPAFSVLTLAYAAILASQLAARRITRKLATFVLGFGLLGVLIAGERDMLFRILLIGVFLFHALYRPIRKREFALLFLVGVVLVSFSGQLKALLISDTPRSLLWEDPTERVVGEEFVTGARNLEELLDEMRGQEFFWGKTLWWDIKWAFVPGFMDHGLPGPGRWFNERRYPRLVAMGGGRGFTLVGEGYMNFGSTGVVLWFSLLGWSVRFLYSRSRTSAFWFLTYVVSVTLFLYVIRADYSNLFSQLLKHIALPSILIVWTAKLAQRFKFAVPSIVGERRA
jgi:hypothetical protein